jgi:hypothetical protein
VQVFWGEQTSVWPGGLGQSSSVLQLGMQSFPVGAVAQVQPFASGGHAPEQSCSDAHVFGEGVPFASAGPGAAGASSSVEAPGPVVTGSLPPLLEQPALRRTAIADASLMRMHDMVSSFHAGLY